MLQRALALSFLALAACTPVDNSGGPPPDGDSVAFEVVAEPAAFCEAQDDAALLRSQADMDAWLEGCSFGDDPRAVLEAALAEVEAGETLVIVSAQLGGCLMGFEVSGVFVDSDTLNIWMLKQDSSYGRTQVACTADLGEGHTLLVVQDAEDTQDIALTVGVWNPELPGGPVSL
jgi:hypothetical protein